MSNFWKITGFRYNVYMKFVHQIVYGVAIAIAVTLYIVVTLAIPSEGVRNIRLAEFYALTGLVFLYLALAVRPLYIAFPGLPLKGVLHEASKTFGVAAFAFGLAHGYIAFFQMLGGFAGLGFLSSKYINAILLSATALVMLGLGALMSVHWVEQKTKSWVAPLLFHAAGLLAIIHALMLGAHFADLSAFIPQLTLYLLLALLLLDSYWLDRLVAKYMNAENKFGLLFVLLIAIIGGAYAWYAFPRNANTSVGLHAQHMQNMQNAATQTANRYSLSMFAEPNIVPNRDTKISFKIFNAANGDHISSFTPIHEKLMHVVIVNNALTSYQHIHPELQADGTFSVVTRFPANDLYRLYATFQPSRETGPEQEFAQTLAVGNFGVISPAQVRDQEDAKFFGDINVRMVGGTVIDAAQAASGNAKISFTLSDKNGDPLTNLRPYLGAFGHLVMISSSGYRYIHVHPLVAPISPDETAGPTVEFALVANVEPGFYRLFLDTDPGGTLFTADFSVEVR